MKFRVFYGCYLDGRDPKNDYPNDIIEANDEYEAERIAYQMACDHVDTWIGMHGFGPDEADYEDDDGIFNTVEYDEAICQAVGDAVDYWVEAL